MLAKSWQMICTKDSQHLGLPRDLHCTLFCSKCIQYARQLPLMWPTGLSSVENAKAKPPHQQIYLFRFNMVDSFTIGWWGICQQKPTSRDRHQLIYVWLSQSVFPIITWPFILLMITCHANIRIDNPLHKYIGSDNYSGVLSLFHASVQEFSLACSSDTETLECPSSVFRIANNLLCRTPTKRLVSLFAPSVKSALSSKMWFCWTKMVWQDKYRIKNQK